MSGLLGFMAAGAAKGYADGRGRELAQEKEFNLKTALLDAQMDKELRLKEAGYAMEDNRKTAEMERNKGYMVGEDGAGLNTQQAATKAMQAGDLETAEKFSKSTPKRETFTLSEGQKVVDADGKLIAEGNPKPEKVDVNDMIFKAAAGDKKAQAFLDKMSAIDIKKAVAGRAPQRETETESRKRDFIDAYSDNAEYVKNGKLTAKGFDKFNKIENDEYQTVTEAPVIGFDGTTRLDKNGKPLMTTKVTRKEKVPEKSNGALSKDKSGNYTYNR
ncbi:MAG: hypothetical protein CTY14_02185 [Methylotenera sp.]|nr:MAG: hypothetical protein CTY14_02185 [Methylotenera sp.]